MKLKIKKLKYPLWIDIVFYCLTIAAPLIALVIQGFCSPYKVFRISFSFVCALLVTWVFLKKFIISKYIDKLKSEKLALEHDYSIDVGNAKKSKYMWLSNELKIMLENLLDTSLLCAMIILIVVGVKNMTFNVTGTSFLVIILYILAFGLKATYLLISKSKLEKDE